MYIHSYIYTPKHNIKKLYFYKKGYFFSQTYLNVGHKSPVSLNRSSTDTIVILFSVSVSKNSPGIVVSAPVLQRHSFAIEIGERQTTCA